MLRCQDIKNNAQEVDKEATRILSQVIKKNVNPHYITVNPCNRNIAVLYMVPKKQKMCHRY